MAHSRLCAMTRLGFFYKLQTFLTVVKEIDLKQPRTDNGDCMTRGICSRSCIFSKDHSVCHTLVDEHNS